MSEETVWQDTYAAQIRATAELVSRLGHEIPARQWAQATLTLDDLIANYRVMAAAVPWMDAKVAACLITAARVAEVAGDRAAALEYIRAAVATAQRVCVDYPQNSGDLETAYREWRRLAGVNRRLRPRRREIGEVDYMHML